MGLEVLKSKVQKMTLGQTKLQTEKTIREHFVRWSHGGGVLSLPQFRMALSELGISARAAEDMFSELDQSRRGSIPIQQVLANVVEAKAPPEHPLQYKNLQENRSASAVDLSRPRDPQQSPVPSSPGGRRSVANIRRSLAVDSEAMQQKKIRGFWDLIGSRAMEKGYKSAAQVLKAMDKDDNGILDRMEARKFFKVNLCLAVTKADEFFNLLDEDKDGKVSCREISKCLAPYLQKSFQCPEAPSWHDDEPGRAEKIRDEELRKFWDMLGHRAVDKGFKSVGQLFLQIDKDDNGLLDRKEMRSFLVNYVGFGSTGADRFFDLLDIEGHGKVKCKELRRCLEPYFQRTYDAPRTEVPEFRSHRDEALEQAERDEEMRRFWDLIGNKFFEKGYRSSGQVLMAMDKNDSMDVDRDEVRIFFQRHLGHGLATADRFFDLLDPHGHGLVPCRDIAQRLAPYFQSTFRAPGEMVAKWEPLPPGQQQQASSQAAAGRPSTNGGTVTPGRRMLRQASMPAYASMPEQDSLRSSRVFEDEQGFPAAGAAMPLGSADGRGQRRASGMELRQSMDEVPVGRGQGAIFRQAGHEDASVCSLNSEVNSERTASAVPDFDLSSSRRSLDLGASRRSMAIREEAPLPAAQGGAAASGSQAGQDPPAAGRPALSAPAPPAGPPGPPAVDLSAAVLAEFRRALLSRKGAHGIHQFGRTFRIMDTNGNMQVSEAELEVALRRFGLDLKQKDLVLLMHAVDQDGSGAISCTEFLRAVRGPMSARRQALVDLAFGCLDRNHNERIEVADIQQLYNVSQHPDVISRAISQETAMENFLGQFEGTSRDGCVTRKEFSEYYANLSASIDDDDYFELMMRNSWRNGRSWPVQLAGPGLPQGDGPRDYVAPRPRRPACWTAGGNGEN